MSETSPGNEAHEAHPLSPATAHRLARITSRFDAGDITAAHAHFLLLDAYWRTVDAEAEDDERHYVMRAGLDFAASQALPDEIVSANWEQAEREYEEWLELIARQAARRAIILI
ncbi:MAG TPA: hypothetical protein VLF91_06520 [Candidatus Saccharimonadales bacterium]|nr:hypothetical protein [Candidatus Saccharimonadales bacterium]